MSKKNRRELLVEAGRFALAGAIAPILSSGASGASEAPAQSRDTKADEKQTEATAEKVIDALEGPAPEPHQGRRCTGFLRWKSRSLHLFALRAFFGQGTGGDHALLPGGRRSRGFRR